MMCKTGPGLVVVQSGAHIPRRAFPLSGPAFSLV